MNTYNLLWKKNWLRNQYLKKGSSIREIADRLGCFWGTVKNALVKLKIPQRRYTLSKDARKARIKGAKSAKPRMDSKPNHKR